MNKEKEIKQRRNELKVKGAIRDVVYCATFVGFCFTIIGIAFAIVKTI